MYEVWSYFQFVYIRFYFSLSNYKNYKSYKNYKNYIRRKYLFIPFYELGLEGFIDILITIFLQLSNHKSSKSGDKTSIVFCYLLIGILVLLFILHLY